MERLEDKPDTEKRIGMFRKMGNYISNLFEPSYGVLMVSSTTPLAPRGYDRSADREEIEKKVKRLLAEHDQE